MGWPPFLVPPEKFSDWDENFYEEFTLWKNHNSDRKDKKEEDFRQFLMDLNKEYNLEDIFDKLEIGWEAFEDLVNFIHRFKTYNLKEDLQTLYTDKDNIHMKDFLEWGARFVYRKLKIGKM